MFYEAFTGKKTGPKEIFRPTVEWKGTREGWLVITAKVDGSYVKIPVCLRDAKWGNYDGSVIDMWGDGNPAVERLCVLFLTWPDKPVHIDRKQRLRKEKEHLEKHGKAAFRATPSLGYDFYYAPGSEIQPNGILGDDGLPEMVDTEGT